jgi:hypothetical protein
MENVNQAYQLHGIRHLLLDGTEETGVYTEMIREKYWELIKADSEESN